MFTTPRGVYKSELNKLLIIIIIIIISSQHICQQHIKFMITVMFDGFQLKYELKSHAIVFYMTCEL